MRLSFTNTHILLVLIELVPPPALTIPESSSKSNSMLMCRHVVSEYFYLFFVLFCILIVFLGATFRQQVVRFVSSIHWAPCCFEVPV